MSHAPPPRAPVRAREGVANLAIPLPIGQSAGWMDHTDVDYLPANGFLATDVIGTSGYGANVRLHAQPEPRVDATGRRVCDL